MSRVQARVLTFLVIAVLFVSLPFAATTPAASGVDGPYGPTAGDTVPSVGPTGTAGAETIEAERVEFRITVYGNGSARWRFLYTRTLETSEERRQFEDFATEFNENETDTYRNFKDRAESLTQTGTNRTRREMDATDFSRNAYLGGDCIEVDRCGTVEMAFTWTNFAREDGDRLVVDDVFEGGMYLLEDQQLVFEHGPDVKFVSAAPESYTSSAPDLRDSSSITWRGETQFADRRPRVVYAPEDQVTPTPIGPQETPGSTTTSTTGGPVQGNSSTWMLLVGIAVLALGAGLALVWRRGDVISLGDGGISVGGDDGGGVASEPAVANEELLSDEDRVLQLLRENGGRMKQVNIVEETGWSKSKVSMLLSDMEEDDQISKLRVGRENIVSLVGHEPDAAGSPHDE
ncbi:hypothetical protein BRC81_12555 [Halobacteriales archaeon QS_1_68_20]|nr:MAG: hypothetical protein BRC81_12555 [Halobacteriales archaeon QS_1_68_20]